MGFIGTITLITLFFCFLTFYMVKNSEDEDNIDSEETNSSDKKTNHKRKKLKVKQSNNVDDNLTFEKDVTEEDIKKTFRYNQ